MTIEEFNLAADNVVRTRELKPHEVVDVQLLRRTVEKHGNVSPLEIMILSWLGVPGTGYVVKPKPKAPPKLKQVKLF